LSSLAPKWAAQLCRKQPLSVCRESGDLIAGEIAQVAGRDLDAVQKPLDFIGAACQSVALVIFEHVPINRLGRSRSLSFAAIFEPCLEAVANAASGLRSNDGFGTSSNISY
jgi:hypothetical protein